MSNKGNGHNHNNALIGNDRLKEFQYKPGIGETYENIEDASRIKEMMRIPEKDDMAGIMVRSIFKNERQRIAAVRLAKRHIKFKDTVNQEALRVFCASTVGQGGVGRLEQLFGVTNLFASDSYRVARGIEKSKKEEKIYHGSDFRQDPNNNTEQNDQRI